MSEITEHSITIIGNRRRAEAPSSVTSIRLSPAEKQRAEIAARINGQKFSEFVRDAVVTASEDCLEGLS